MGDEYRTVKSESRGIFKDRGSKFIAIAYPVDTIENTKDILSELRKEYHDARHHCYAYKLGLTDDNWRVNDDGEPSGTAGNPILGQIKSYDLNNVLIVVIRYFGGTLLGTGGLINAYKTAAKEALQNAEIITKIVKSKYRLSYPYSAMNDVMKIIKEENLEQSEQVFELDCSLIVSFRSSIEKNICKRFELVEKLEYEKIVQE